MPAYYNENEPFCVEWLKNLIAKGLIAPGDVDDRSIKDVQPDDLKGYNQVHMFSGLGGWSYALRRAGWPDDRHVWTGSCPCQPWSVSGRRQGVDDPRHLWPDWQRLIAQRYPNILLGEQVSRAPEWINLVRGDLVRLGYAVGCVPIEAASAGADHFRDRYWFVADAYDQRSQEPVGESADPGPELPAATGSDLRDVVDSPLDGWGEGWSEHEFRSRGFTAAYTSFRGRQYIQCPDGKWRRLPPPSVLWLGTRVPARIPRVRAIGNSIDVRPATAFIKSYMELHRA